MTEGVEDDTCHAADRCWCRCEFGRHHVVQRLTGAIKAVVEPKRAAMIGRMLIEGGDMVPVRPRSLPMFTLVAASHEQGHPTTSGNKEEIAPLHLPEGYRSTASQDAENHETKI